MKNSLILSILAFLFLNVLTIYAQEEPPAPNTINNQSAEERENKINWQHKIFTGGGIGLSFGSYTYVGLSPIIGYRITDKFSAGLGFTYIYLNDKSIRLTTSIYGGKIFAEYDVFRGLAPHIEYEVLNREVFLNNSFVRKRINVDSFLIGASYTQSIGDHSGIYIMLLYNLLEDIYSPYENPIMRVGFNIGL